jgi:hypothetical protein
MPLNIPVQGAQRPEILNIVLVVGPQFHPELL